MSLKHKYLKSIAEVPGNGDSPEATKPVEQKKKRGRPKVPFSVEARKPWEAEGVSRRTWYARKRERKIFEEGRKAAAAKPSPEDDSW